jgi:glycosyltransferase involved in cell wall biosynthesis
MRIALLHHWLVSFGGGERVLEVMGEMFPDADLVTLLYRPSDLPVSLRDRNIITSPFQKIPGATSFHRHLMPLYPWAVESIDVSKYDLLISSDSGPIKGVLKRPDATHICYCHSPMRYLWVASDEYAAHMSWPTRLAFRTTIPRVRAWDFRAAQRVNYFLANSENIAERILNCYGRESTVIYPPVETTLAADAVRVAASIRHPDAPQEDYYFTIGRFVQYKRNDLIIEACNRLGRRLRIAGVGPDERRLRSIAGPTVEFLGQITGEELWKQYAACRALIFAADEDFGMVPVEAQACGRPVIAYGKGGALETVHAVSDAVSPATGVLFYKQTVEAVIAAIEEFESRERTFDPAAITRFAQRFNREHFVRDLGAFVAEHVPAAVPHMRITP